MKNLKKLSREELRKVNGGKYVAGVNCVDYCKPNDGKCEQYGLSCGLWVNEAPNGTINYACTKCF